MNGMADLNFNEDALIRPNNSNLVHPILICIFHICLASLHGSPPPWKDYWYITL